MAVPTVSKKETVQKTLPLDCPFCNAPAQVYSVWGTWGVECTFCDARIHDYSTREGAVSAWNRPRRMPRPERGMDDPAWIIRIEPCCKEMSDTIMMNDIRQGVVRDQDGSLSILWGDGDTMPLRYCPCCGKRVEPLDGNPVRSRNPKPLRPLFRPRSVIHLYNQRITQHNPMATAIGRTED